MNVVSSSYYVLSFVSCSAASLLLGFKRKTSLNSSMAASCRCSCSFSNPDEGKNLKMKFHSHEYTEYALL